MKRHPERRRLLIVPCVVALAALLVVGGCQAHTHTDAEKTIITHVDQEFTISLRVTPRLGAYWEESHDGNLLTLLESQIVMDKPSEPVSGNAEFRFKALKKGKTEITFTLGSGSTGPVRDQKVFTVDIK
ncbi:hypothetical protein ES703_98889 [subsurface metagenome]